jgi:hypothetical protein
MVTGFQIPRPRKIGSLSLMTMRRHRKAAAALICFQCRQRCDPNEAPECLPMPWMSFSFAGTNSRCVGKGNIQRSSYGTDRKFRETRSNSFTVTMLVEPRWLLRWSPGSAGERVAASTLRPQGFSLFAVRGHSTLCSTFDERRSRSGNSARWAVAMSFRYRFSARLAQR